MAFASGAAPVLAEEAAPADAGSPDPVDRKAEELETVKVQGQGVKNASSPKFTAPLLDTPRSVTVVPQALINDMGATDLIDALRVVPGITFGAGEGGNPQGDRPYLRGYDSQNSMFVDGVRDVGAQTRETFNIQQIEVVKGPDSVYSGRSNGGGSINLVSKNAVAGNFTNLTAELGSADHKRATIDSNWMLGDNAALRVNLMGQDSDVAGRDELFKRRFGFAPSVTFGLNSPTSATISFYHLNTTELPDAGTPYHFGFSNVPAGVRTVGPDDGGNRDNFYGLVDRDFRKTDTNIGTLQLRHEFSDSWVLRNTTRYGRSQQDYILSQPDDSQGNVAKGMVWRRANTRAGNTVTAVNQTDLSGVFDLGGMRNDFNVGLEFANEKSTRDSYVVPAINAANACRLGVGAASYYYCTSLYRPNPRDPWVPGTLGPNDSFVPGAITRANAPIRTTSNTQALYAFDTIRFSDQWLLNLGVRYDRFSTKAPLTFCPGQVNQACPNGYTGERITAQHRSEANEWTWQTGLVWKPVEQGSVYFSYSTAVTPPGSFLGEGSDGNPISVLDLKPEKSRNLELGVKWELLDRRFTVNADVFETRKTDARQLGPDGWYANIGETRVRGAEISVSGNIADGWSVFGGYAYMKSELVDGGFVAGKPNPVNGTQLANTPKNSFSLWTTWQIVPSFSVGGGAFYVDDVVGSYRVNAADNRLTEYGVPSYWRFDAMANWTYSESLSFRLNLQNLGDKTYYTKAYPAHFAVMAPGRSAVLSASLKF
ncbi:MAG: TonB-dependent receptor [Dokdonella sp.]|nr:TonB-dependent receptor [Dokdonella sp.]